MVLDRCRWHVRNFNKKRFLAFLAITSIIFQICTWYYTVKLPTAVRIAENYFDVHGTPKTWIQTPVCTVPYDQRGPLDFNTKENHRYIERMNCNTTTEKFVDVKGNVLFGVRETPKDAQLRCCYKGIIRSLDAEDDFKYSRRCTPIDLQLGTEVTEYTAVLVWCSYNGLVSKDLLPIILKRKTELSADVPNIVILGMDSVSRYHFYTYMPKTKRELEKLGAYSFEGHTVVGDNTFPNMVPFLTGYSDDDVSLFCYDADKPIDHCPFLWKNMTMLTAWAEDSPDMGTFTMFRRGFREQPVDQYMRPIFLAAYDLHNGWFGNDVTWTCVGSTPIEVFVLNHVKQLLEGDQPVFSFNWFSAIAHEGPELDSYMDELLYGWLKSVNLTNTILIVMSDHGNRYGPERISFNGWYNHRLPLMTVTFPESVKRALGLEKLNVFKQNTKRITTSFDMYQTLVDLLKMYNLKDFEAETKALEKLPAYQSSKHYLKRKGQSLFTPISENRTCSDAQVPSYKCPCKDVRAIDIHDREVYDIAQAAVDQINRSLPRKCKQLRLFEITGSAALDRVGVIVGFVTEPGGFHFEAYKTRGQSRIEILRTTQAKIVWCTSHHVWKLYCYCDVIGTVLQLFLGDGISRR